MHSLFRNLTCAAFVAVASAVPVTCQAERIIDNWNDLNSHPRIVRYNPHTDEIFRQESVLTRPLRAPGGKESYSGNRLRQYRFIGKRGRGGMYDAFEEYHKRIGADPKNYKFRLR